MKRIILTLAVAGTFLGAAACGGGSSDPGGTSGSTGATGPTGPTGGGGSTGPALGLTLKAGDHWEFLWTYEHTSVSSTGSSTEMKSGIFRVTVGAPSTLGGHVSLPLTVSGDSSDGWADFAPEWKALAVDGAELLGSADLSTWKTVMRETGTWTGGGFFISFGAATMQAASGEMSGQYNTVPALSVSNGQTSGGCTYHPETGGTICSDSSTTIREREYYKRGIGPIGYSQYIGVTDSGGGFYTANTITRTVELVGTTLAAADGTIFRPPASREVRRMPAARANHGCAALGGKIYVVGGVDAAGATDTVFVYDPATDAWTTTTPLVAAASPRVVAAQGLLVAFPVLGSATTFDPATSTWTHRRGSSIPWDDPSYSAFHDPTSDRAGVIVSNLYGGLLAFAFDPAQSRWIAGTPLTGTPDRRWFSAASLGTSVYVTGGYMQDLMGDKVRSDAVRQDLTTGTWYGQGGFFDDGRYSHASASAGGKLLVLGGETVASYLRSVESFDPATGQWTRLLPLMRSRRHACAVELGGKIYLMGGDVGGSSILDSVEVYQP